MLGIMSDSHDHMAAIWKAVKIFNLNEVSTVLHAGDLISPFTSGEFKRLNSRFEAVFGNNDGEREGLKLSYHELCNLEDFKELNIDGLKIAIYHGTKKPFTDALKNCGKYDVLIRGHSHQLEIIEGDTLEINPGETCGYLSGKQTVLLLDTDSLSIETVYL
jgi:putative phosphoesterase